MKLSFQTFSGLVQNMAATVQSSAAQILDLKPGSVLRALLEANASIALWMQWLTLQVLQTTRAATSSGENLDSWVGDFSVARLPATAATGSVIFSSTTPGLPALIPLGALVRTADAALTFSVTADSANPLFDPRQNGYAVPAGSASAALPISATVPGSAGNVQQGTISVLATSIPGIDFVTNPAPLANGMDAESDGALRARFAGFLASRSRATPAAIAYAIATVQQGLNFRMIENYDLSGTPRAGNFIVIVDDGSGSPTDSLLSAVYQAVDAVRPLGSTFSVSAPDVVAVGVSLTIGIAAGGNRDGLIAAISEAITNHINSIPIGSGLPATLVAKLAYDASGFVTTVRDVLLNGSSEDVLPPPHGVLKAGNVLVSTDAG